MPEPSANTHPAIAASGVMPSGTPAPEVPRPASSPPGAGPAPRPSPPQPTPAAPVPAEPADELREALAEARGELDALRAALDAAERRRAIERALIEADVIDLETAMLLADAAVQRTEGPADIAGAVADLRRRKPFLFAQRAPRSAAMAPRSGPPDRLAATREAAASTGDRGALLRYLRQRRSA